MLPPIVDVKLNTEGFADSVGWLETVNVTGTVTDPFVEPAAVIVMEPLYVWAVSPVVLTSTFTVPGVDPEPVTTSHGVAVLEVKVSGVPLLVIFSICVAGWLPPNWNAKLRAEGEA